MNRHNIALSAIYHSGRSRSNSHVTSDKYSIFQLDLGLKSPPTKPAEILAGWAVEPHGSASKEQRYIIHNLNFDYRIAPPFFGDEVDRALRILGAASKHPSANSANEIIDLAWEYIASASTRGVA